MFQLPAVSAQMSSTMITSDRKDMGITPRSLPTTMMVTFAPTRSRRPCTMPTRTTTLAMATLVTTVRTTSRYDRRNLWRTTTRRTFPWEGLHGPTTCEYTPDELSGYKLILIYRYGYGYGYGYGYDQPDHVSAHEPAGWHGGWDSNQFGMRTCGIPLQDEFG